MSGILWIYGAFKTTGNSEKTRLNNNVSDLQVVALEKGLSSQLEIPSWMIVQNLFSQSELIVFAPRVPSCLELTEV